MRGQSPSRGWILRMTLPFGSGHSISHVWGIQSWGSSAMFLCLAGIMGSILFSAQWQMAKDDPPEANEAYLALLREGVDPHEARHAVGCLMAEMIWLTLKNRLPEPKTHYASQLRELKHLGLRHRVFSGR